MAKKKKGSGGFGCLLRLLMLAVVGLAVFGGYLILSGKGLGAAGSEGQRLVNVVRDFVSQVDFNSDPNEEKEVAFRFAVLADSHEDTRVFPMIVDQIEQRGDLAFVAFLGDASNAGELAKLNEAKAYLDNISVPVHVLPGDHDRNWLPERDLRNFKQVFGMTATSFSFSKDQQRFIFLDNSNSAEGIDETTWQWLQNELEAARDSSIIVLVSTPLYNPYLTFKTMGSQSQEVKQQANELRTLLSKYPVKVIFAGDTHSFSQYKDQEFGLDVVTVGSAGSDKNLLPLYVLVEIFSDGSYTATSVPYEK